MRKNLLSVLNLNSSNWRRWLLAAGLLLVFVQGLLQLYEVQNFFSPGQYQAAKLNLIQKEYRKIDRGLTSLQDQLAILTPSSRPSAAAPPPLTAAEARCSPDPAWQAALHAAKKKWVYAARKLNHIGLILPAMQQGLVAQLADAGSESSAQKPRLEKTLQQIQESRALWQTYEDNLHDLSIKLNKIIECGGHPQPIIIPLNKLR
jgi:hypothetical protein